MSPALTSHSNLDHLRKEAKRWLRAIRNGNAQALERLTAFYPHAPEAPSLRDVQHALALAYGATSWSTLKAALAEHAVENRSHEERVADFLRQACIRYDNDHPSSWREAACMLERHREIGRAGIHAACVSGEIDVVKEALAQRPDAVNEKFGPLAWEPLLYVCYARLPIASAAENSLAIARALLDAGANPNVTFDTEGSYAFSALTGVVGEGEGTRLTQPPHPRAEELAKLLIERGADPYDPQTLYNTSLAEDDVFWLDFLYRHSLERGDSDKWVAESARWPHSSMLDYLLGNAVAHNHLKRAGWLLERGARAAARGYYDKVNLHTKAVLSGDTEMASLLARHGAEVEPLEGYNLFYAACMTLDRVAASRYAEQHPEYLLNPTPMLRAAAQNRTDILAMLFELGASANAAEEPSGLTPLHAAARHDAAQAAQYLISRGAHVDVPDRNYDSTPLGWALYFDKREAARVIAEASCAIRPLTAMGYLDRLRVVLADRSEPLTKDDSAALFALPEDETVAVDIARLLLAHGADPRVRNENGSTPAEHAAKRGLDEVAEMLEDRSI